MWAQSTDLYTGTNFHLCLSPFYVNVICSMYSIAEFGIFWYEH